MASLQNTIGYLPWKRNARDNASVSERLKAPHMLMMENVEGDNELESQLGQMSIGVSSVPEKK